MYWYWENLLKGWQEISARISFNESRTLGKYCQKVSCWESQYSKLSLLRKSPRNTDMKSPSNVVCRAGQPDSWLGTKINNNLYNRHSTLPSVLYTNCWSLTQWKLEELPVYADIHTPDLICNVVMMNHLNLVSDRFPIHKHGLRQEDLSRKDRRKMGFGTKDYVSPSEILSLYRKVTQV